MSELLLAITDLTVDFIVLLSFQKNYNGLTVFLLLLNITILYE